MIILDAKPTARFLGQCRPCVLPLHIEDNQAVGDTKRAICPECAAIVVIERLYGVTSDASCNGACMTAVGPTCECGCGGANHGKAYAVKFSTEYASAVQAHRARAAAREAAALKRAESKARAARKAFDAWATDNRDVIEFLGNGDAFATGADGASDFLYEMAGIIARYSPVKPLTPNQADAVRRCMAHAQRQAARRAQWATEKTAPCPTGTQVITGTVVKVWDEESHYGYRSQIIYKMTVKSPDGYMVRATVPAALWNAVQKLDDLKGKRVRFTAEISRGNRSESYGFAKRPRTASILTEVAA